jgi:hypothetical protein
VSSDPDETEYEDDDVEYEDDPFEEDFEEELKPEPMEFPDAYSAAAAKPVELVVPGHTDGFAVLEEVPERRFPAKRVAKSAESLAAALKAALK